MAVKKRGGLYLAASIGLSMASMLAAGETLAIVESSSYYHHDVDRQAAKLPVARVFLADLTDFQVYRQVPTYSLPSVCTNGHGRFLVASQTPPDVHPEATLIQELVANATTTKNKFTIPVRIHQNWNAGTPFPPVIISASDGYLWLKSGSPPPPEKKELGVIFRIECVDLAQKKIISSYSLPDECFRSLHFALGKTCVLFHDLPDSKCEILLLKPDGTNVPIRKPAGFTMPHCGAVNDRTLAVISSSDGLVSVFQLNEKGDALELHKSRLVDELKDTPGGILSATMLEDGKFTVHYRDAEVEGHPRKEVVSVLDLEKYEVLVLRELPRLSAGIFFKNGSFYSIEDAGLVEYDKAFKLLRSAPIITLTGGTITK